MPHQDDDLIALTAAIVSAYVARNNLPPVDLPRVIASTHAALAGLAGPPPPVAAEPLVPAVPIRKSVTPDAIICLEDGRRFKTLKRHLSSAYGLTPDQYREMESANRLPDGGAKLRRSAIRNGKVDWPRP